MSLEIKLPDLGDNIDSGTVVSIFVNKGDTIEAEQALIELETDKAVIEVPSTEAGIVSKILVKAGDEIKIGQTILELDSNGTEASKVSDSPEQKSEIQETPATKKLEKPEIKKEPEPNEKASAGPIDFLIPNMGDNVDSGIVSSVLVNIGDEIKVEQGLVELETDKAVIEVPADSSGIVKEILIKNGDTVKVGQKIMVLEGMTSTVLKTTIQTIEETAATSEPAKPEKPTQVTRELVHDTVAPVVFEKPKSKIAPASPSIRRFAREIGVYIHNVPGSGPGGRISIDDVKAFSKRLNQEKGPVGSTAGIIAIEPLPDFTKWGSIEKEKFSKLRETSAKHLSYAWSSIPHVTQHDKADITELEKLRKQNGKKAEAAGGKLTMTAILIKIIEAALKKFPQFNASIDMSAQEVIIKKYYNIGIAVATERGLLVPVIKDVDKKNIIDLSVELTEISSKARDRKLTVQEMQGGNFSISNLGGIGGTGFTPIVNAPEVAILGVSRSEMQPKYIDGEFKPRLIMPLALSYDHRIIDGADAAYFLRWVCEVIEEPFNILLEG